MVVCRLGFLAHYYRTGEKLDTAPCCGRGKADPNRAADSSVYAAALGLALEFLNLRAAPGVIPPWYMSCTS